MKYKEFVSQFSSEGVTKTSSRSFSTNKLYIDQSSLNIDEQAFDLFEEYAKKNNFVEKFNGLISGQRLNNTENREVTHFKYRNKESNIYEASLEKMEALASEIKGRFKKIIIFGIGGSYLGPKLMADIFSSQDLKIDFVTGSDSSEYQKYTEQDLSDCAFIITSKSFSTIETLTSYSTITNGKLLDQTYAITSVVEKAEAYGIDSNNIAEIDLGTGGRFSIWSAVNLGLFICLGRAGFENFLAGAKSIDDLSSIDTKSNPALALAIQDLIMNNVLGMDSTLILNYDYRLRDFSSYAQQLEMESLGKNVDRDTGETLSYETGSIVWGGYGPRSQHSFFQHLFQGTKEANTYFIVSKTDNLNFKQFKGQTASLISGNDNELDPHKKVTKRRFSSLVLEDLSPESIGELIAIWENKTIFMSMFWNINPFDQWGVELGKINTKKEIE
jgi:glucose-6-phosphate isomerase|tara:strand:- start:247 stop:1575 length:1329 start_codon:yes stop_codon:yes gene_type:complete